jgi:gamma-glutamylcyclotransferase
VILVSIGEMRGAGLRFHKIGRDGSGKCNVVTAGEYEETVLGAVYRLTRNQVRALDGFESLGQGYERHVTDICFPSGGIGRCFTYVAMPEFIDERLAPFSWYTALVALGARYHGFPQEYIAKLERQPGAADPRALRAEDERNRAARMRRSADL